MSIRPLSHYIREDVAKEIIDYCKGRWVAIETSGDRRKFLRYWPRIGSPLTIDGYTEYRSLLQQFRGLGVRTIYASINIYHRLEKKDHIKDVDNIYKSTPVWDIDGSLDYVDDVLRVAKEICSLLNSYGVSESIYLVWSGRGVHIHINENAISKEVRAKYNPIDVSYAMVEYIIGKAYPKIRDLLNKHSRDSRPLKVENKIDIQRVFTAPLSLHKIHDIVCVAFKPDDIDSFDISWTRPGNYRHDPSWREYIEGEADLLAEQAIKTVGTYLSKYRPRPTISTSKLIRRAIETPLIRGKIGRFQVMGLLQAARYYVIYGDIDKAKSFGLNRAIFYAWAKYYKPVYGRSRRHLYRMHKDMEKAGNYIDIGGEKAYLSSEGWFIIGDKPQKPEDFDREVAQKIEEVVSFNIAWEAALDYIKRFPLETIKSQRGFYEKIYKPVRDEFIKIIQEYISMRRIVEDKDVRDNHPTN